MIKYLAQRIIDGVLTYESVVSKRPDLREQLDIELGERGFANF